MKDVILEEIETYDQSVIDDIIDNVYLEDEYSRYKKIGLTIGLLTVAGVVSTPVFALVGFKVGSLVAAVSTTASLTMGLLY